MRPNPLVKLEKGSIEIVRAEQPTLARELYMSSCPSQSPRQRQGWRTCEVGPVEAEGAGALVDSYTRDKIKGAVGEGEY